MSLATFYLNNMYSRLSGFRGSTWLGRRIVQREFSEANLVSKESYSAFLKEPLFVKEFEEAVSKDSVVCDVGAFHGAYSILGLKGELVHCFEMDGENLGALKRNLEANRCLGAYKINNKAVWSSEGFIEASLGEEGTSSVVEGCNKVESINLDSYFEDKVDLPVCINCGGEQT